MKPVWRPSEPEDEKSDSDVVEALRYRLCLTVRARNQARPHVWGAHDQLDILHNEASHQKYRDV